MPPAVWSSTHMYLMHKYVIHYNTKIRHQRNILSLYVRYVGMLKFKKISKDYNNVLNR